MGWMGLMFKSRNIIGYCDPLDSNLLNNKVEPFLKLLREKTRYHATKKLSITIASKFRNFFRHHDQFAYLLLDSL